MVTVYDRTDGDDFREVALLPVPQFVRHLDEGVRLRSTRAVAAPISRVCLRPSDVQALLDEGAIIVPCRVAVVAARQLIQQTRSERAERQRRYRERLREAARVTHHPLTNRPPGVVGVTPPAVCITETPHGPPVRAWKSTQPVVCARCGRLGGFLRHETLAFTGPTERQRCFRFRARGP
jgi:hypothetical protein